MKKEIYKDYTKSSNYFKDDNKELLEQEINAVENNKKYFVWVQSFSKKVVVITFLAYISLSLLSTVLICLTYREGSMIGLDTLISEINVTFREVIGAYIIKSGVENACKIGGNYFVGISEARLEALRRRYDEKYKASDNDSSEDICQEEAEVNEDGILINSGDTTC